MNKLFKYTLPMVALCGALASCSEDTTSGGIEDPNHGKELIALSGNDNGVTRAALTRAGFSTTDETKVVMRIKAVDKSGAFKDARFTEATATAGVETTEDKIKLSKLTYTDGTARYWDDAFGRDSKLTIYAFAIPGKTNATLPTWNFGTKTVVDASTNPNWYTGNESTTVSWNVSAAQTSTTMAAEDLTYSNNISSDTNLGKGGRYTYTYDTSKNDWTETKFANGPLTWTPKTDATGETSGKFDKGHLEFHHALAWIEINLKEGDGFKNDDNTDFTWTKDQKSATQNITLTGFNTVGTFDVANGKWDENSFTSSVNITQMKESTGEPAKQTTRKLEAYVLPGTNLFTTTSNVVEFEIDNSKYYVTGLQIANAIRKYYTSGAGKVENVTSPYETFTTIESGKHYVINLSVAKKGINDITAAIVNWETVNSDDAEAKNTYPTFTLDDRGTKLDDGSKSKFNLYRAAKTAANFIDGTTTPNYAWETGYKGTDATKKYESSLWKTDWYWENNLTYYHFRAAGADVTDGASTVSIVTDANDGDYFSIKSGAISGSDYKDYIWGAPFNLNKENDTYKQFTYSTTNGFDGTSTTTHQLSHAIGATDSKISMLLFHMTSQITVNVMTTTDASKLVLNNGTTNTKVEILNFLPDGKVLIGNGLVVTTSTTRDSKEMTAGTYTAGGDSNAAKVTGYSYGIVPQPLTYTDGTIGLRITTPDGNQYIVKDLSKCTAKVSNGNLTIPYKAATTGYYNIDAWYPNYKYNYTVTIKKTGIDHITAAVVGWEEVTGDLGVIDLEN